MRYWYLFFFLSIIFCSCRTSENRKSEKKIDDNTHDKYVEKFLTSKLDAHRLLLEQGRLLRDCGISATVRKYGVSMIIDETELISKIERLSHRKKIKPSSCLNEKGAAELDQFKSAKEKDFDKRTLKIIASEYKQILNEIENRKFIPDPDFENLVSDEFIIIQKHSDRIDALKQDLWEKHFSVKAKYRAWNRGYMVSLLLGQFLI